MICEIPDDLDVLDEGMHVYLSVGAVLFRSRLYVVTSRDDNSHTLKLTNPYDHAETPIILGWTEPRYSTHGWRVLTHDPMKARKKRCYSRREAPIEIETRQECAT